MVLSYLLEFPLKRSEINTIIRSADTFIRAHGFYLPPFAYWTPQDWRAKGPEVREIVDNHLGWDITDFGCGDFAKFGLFLFTIRNGGPENWEKRTGKLYAEKIMIVEEGQVTPCHFHWAKMEDIINRGGGNLLIELYNALPNDRLDLENPVSLSVDGTARIFQPGEVLRLTPGESVSLPQRCYHKFWADGGRTLIGEVSMVNDDSLDNCFLDPIGRFPAIEEDQAPLHLLCNDYDRYYLAK
jgi:D-lyxose ketol-isomerase